MFSSSSSSSYFYYERFQTPNKQREWVYWNERRLNRALYRHEPIVKLRWRRWTFIHLIYFIYNTINLLMFIFKNFMNWRNLKKKCEKIQVEHKSMRKAALPHFPWVINIRLIVRRAINTNRWDSQQSGPQNLITFTGLRILLSLREIQKSDFSTFQPALILGPILSPCTRTEKTHSIDVKYMSTCVIGC